VSKTASNGAIQAAIDEALNPATAPAPVKTKKDFSPEEIRQMERQYRRKK
jgi:hypothetical protein